MPEKIEELQTHLSSNLKLEVGPWTTALADYVRGFAKLSSLLSRDFSVVLRTWLKKLKIWKIKKLSSYDRSYSEKDYEFFYPGSCEFCRCSYH